MCQEDRVTEGKIKGTATCVAQVLLCQWLPLCTASARGTQTPLQALCTSTWRVHRATARATSGAAMPGVSKCCDVQGLGREAVCDRTRC